MCCDGPSTTAASTSPTACTSRHNPVEKNLEPRIVPTMVLQATDAAAAMDRRFAKVSSRATHSFFFLASTE